MPLARRLRVIAWGRLMSPPGAGQLGDIMLVEAFERFGNEGQIIGRLLTGYTAVEYQLCMCAGMGGGAVEQAITDLYSKQGRPGA